MSEPIVEITKDFNAPAEMIYDAWLDPEAVKEFMKPADVITVPEPLIDSQIGGKFAFDMHMGERIIPHKGEYRILERPGKIQFTWNSSNTNNEDSIVTITIDATSEKTCTLKLIHELLPTEDSRKDHTGGWTNILEHLSKRISL